MITESWLLNKHYTIGDIVYIFDVSSTCYYICIHNHISKTALYPTNKKNWLLIKQEFVDEMIQHGIQIGSWNNTPTNPNNGGNDWGAGITFGAFNTSGNTATFSKGGNFGTFSTGNFGILGETFSPIGNSKTTEDIKICSEDNLENNNMKRKLNKMEMEIEKYNITKKAKTTLSKKDQILLLKTDVETKSYLLDKYQDIKKEASSDYDKSIKWLNTVLKLPFNEKVSYDINLKKIKETLDEEIYGNENIKRNILQYFAKKKTNPDTKGEILALHGNPGVGKTKIVRDGLAKAINVPFFQINCGGLNDVAIITGHSSTYVGSKPGKIVDFLIESKCSNPIIYIDELDKISEYRKKELYGIFTHIFDEQQNKSFQDNYIGNVDIDLSNIFFVVSFNNISAIDPILLDRFKIINVPDPSFNDKIEICKKMFKTIKNEIWTKNKVKIEDEDCFFEYLISNYHSTDIGVRQIKKSINTILENINLDNQLNNKKVDKDILIKMEYIDKYLYKNKENKEYLNMYL